MPDERVHIQTFSNPALKDRFLQTIQQRLVRDLAKARPDKIRQEKTHHEERVQLPKFTSHTFTSGPQFTSFFACQTHAQAYFPKVVAQGDTLFSAKHVLSYITQPPRSTPNPPSFLPSYNQGILKN
jgi:hypothetical protein